MPRIIDRFKGKYEIFSNFTRLPMTMRYNDIYYKTSEAAYQASKCKNQSDKAQFGSIYSGAEAKAKGQLIEIREDWDDVKVGIMKEILQLKFREGYASANTLLKTEDAILIEGNDHNDTFWGVCNGMGKNMLGILLMEVREELRDARSKSKIYY